MMEYGMFTMPSHPPERSLYDGHRWDLQTLRWADELVPVKSSINFEIQRASFTVSLSATYSASIVDWATTFWSFECQETAPPASMVTIPDVDFLVLMSPA
jgi:hypothetical protein